MKQVSAHTNALDRREQQCTTLRYLIDYNVIFMHCQSFNLLLEVVLPSRHRGDCVQGQVRRLTLDTRLRPVDISFCCICTCGCLHPSCGYFFLLYLYLCVGYGCPPTSCGYFFVFYLYLCVDYECPPKSCQYFFLLYFYLFVDYGCLSSS